MTPIALAAPLLGAFSLETSRFLQAIVEGISLAAIYCLIAIGFVIIYKSTQVLSFAQPALLIVGAYLAEAARMLQWGEDPWHALTSTLKESTGRKGKPLFLPLRQALTGMDHGPDMAELLPLIGEAEVRARLERAAHG